MVLMRWWRGLQNYLFPAGATNVRLYCADGQVLYEIYERSRQEGDPVLNKEQSAQDFFRAIIVEIFQNHDIVRRRPIKITEVADYIEACAGTDWRLLPLCYFFASIWSIDFRDENDPSNESDYRTRRFAEALRWGSGGNVDLKFDSAPDFFSKGIERLFDLLAKGDVYRGRIFMPPTDFKYRCRADGITLSHSIFHYGNIAKIYTAFSDWGLEPNCEYEGELFGKIASEFYDDLSGRCVDRQTLQVAIEKLYRGWDGTATEKKYRHYIAHGRDAAGDNVPIDQPNITCKAYWSLIPDRFNQLKVGICLDSIEGITHDIVASNGQSRITIPAAAVIGTTCFQWLGNGDRLTNTPGWMDLASRNEIAFGHDDTRLSAIAPFSRCFDGHAIILLQSYVPPAGGNPIWRLMVGSQGVELWGGDGRRNDTQYALMSPVEIREEDVNCGGLVDIVNIGRLIVGQVPYNVYKLCGDLSGDLIVKELLLFNFGISNEGMDAKEYFVSERIEVRKLFGRDYVAPPRMTVFYMPAEQRIAVYCPQDTIERQPSLYGISELDICSCEIKPLSNHRLDFRFDGECGLWITEEMDACDIPYAIGMLPPDSNRMSFVVVDSEGEDYHASWKGYFLPKLEEDDLIITGALLARGWRPIIAETLRSEVRDLAIDGTCMQPLLSLLEGVRVNDSDNKLAFIQDVGSMLTTRLVNGAQNNPALGCFRDAFGLLHGELGTFVGDIPANGRLRNLNEYFAWALILLSVYYDRIGIREANFNGYMRFHRTLMDFSPNPNLPSRHYCAYFVCFGIVHAVLDGISDEDAQRIVSRGVALADSLVSSLI